MVLPLMTMMYIGMTDLTFAISTDRKVTLLSRALADLTGRATTVNSSDMDLIFGAAASVMAPYDATLVVMTVSSIVVTNTGTQANPVIEGTVCWSVAKGTNAVALTKGTKVPVPDGFRNPNTSYIQSYVTMPYNPLFGSTFLNMVNKTSITLSDEAPWPVRNVKEVVWSGTTPCLP